MNRFRIETHRQKSRPQWRFVESVRVRRVREPVRVNWRYPFLAIFLILILAKCLLAHWAIVRWQMPVGAVYVWAPTVFAAIVCTVALLAKPDRPEEDWPDAER